MCRTRAEENNRNQIKRKVVWHWIDYGYLSEKVSKRYMKWEKPIHLGLCTSQKYKNRALILFSYRLALPKLSLVLALIGVLSGASSLALQLFIERRPLCGNHVNMLSGRDGKAGLIAATNSVSKKSLNGASAIPQK